MAENDTILEQRVEALEQFSQARVVEQVGELTERVSSLESAREAEKPHLATKSDIARLEGLHAATQGQIAAQSAQFSKDLQVLSEQVDRRFIAQSAQFSKDLQALSEQVDRRFIAQSAQFSKDLQALSEQVDRRFIAQSAQFSKDLQALSEQVDRR
ncbi:MAG: hypothetical protein OXG85_14660, partial [Chloroflexi bacterium]|nr:hypothetical protein [Chloroflexota bacterium]